MPGHLAEIENYTAPARLSEVVCNSRPEWGLSLPAFTFEKAYCVGQLRVCGCPMLHILASSKVEEVSPIEVSIKALDIHLQFNHSC